MKNGKAECRELVDEVFKVPGVRYAAVVNGHGERIVGGMKPGVQTVAPESVEIQLELQSLLILKMAQDHQKYFEELRYSTIRWKRLDGVFFLLSQDRALSMTVESSNLTDALPKLEKKVIDWKNRN